MKKYEHRMGKYKDLLAIQTDYNNHIHYIRVDADGNEEWVGHSSCRVKLTDEQLSKDAENIYKLMHRNIDELIKKDEAN